MRSLKPFTIFVGGSILVAATLTVVATAALPDARNPRGVALGLAVGVLFGMLVFGPIAAADVFRPGLVRRHFPQLERWSALLGAMGLGHLVGYSMGDWGLLTAYALLLLCAAFRTYLAGWVRRPAA